MLAQHIVIKPVLDELFRGYPFTEKNAIASAMTKMLERLDADGLTRTNDELKGFYQSVGFRMQNVTSVSDRQKVIVDLFDRFFKVAFPKQQDKLGIVYTPIEVVDFITHSVNDILQKEINYKSRLLEWCHKRHIEPEFDLVKETVQRNRHTFHTCLKIQGHIISQATGSSKKESQQRAAEIAYKQIKDDPRFLQALVESQPAADQ